MSGENPIVVVGHFDVHGVVTSALAYKATNASEAFAKFPDTGPENLLHTLQNRYVASPRRLTILVIDIPINLKAPKSFCDGLNEVATRHEVWYYDHHETSIQYLPLLKDVKVVFKGPSALMLTESFVDPNDPSDHKWAIVAAIGDRDPLVIQRGLWSPELQRIADGMDVLVRRDTNGTLQALIRDPGDVEQKAREVSDQIPTAPLEKVQGCVAIARGLLPEQWSLKALERLAFREGTIYAVGYTYVHRFNVYTVRAIARWDEIARNPSLPLPGNIAKELFPTRNIIGHPSAPSISASSEEEAREMATKLANALNEARFGALTPRTQRFINETEIGRVLVEILDEMRKMYREYLELKKQQVSLLKELREERAD